jgi:hypothetical protein
LGPPLLLPFLLTLGTALLGGILVGAIMRVSRAQKRA